MTYDSPCIEQPGLVTALTAGRIKVALQGNGGCSTCHDALCMLGKSQARWVETPSGSNSLNIGDTVMVRINRASGYAGVLWLYLVPFVLMVLTLIGILKLGQPESLAGVMAIFVLVPYFLVLYIFRKKMAAQCWVQIIKK